jgi:hypothetical protein
MVDKVKQPNPYKLLDKILGKLDVSLTEFQCLILEIDTQIEMLTELRGEVYERTEKLAQALDLNRTESVAVRKARR